MTKSNPYKLSPSNDPGGRTQGTRWLVWLGLACLTLSLGCFTLACVIAYAAFRSIATSPSAPQPAQLAAALRWTVLPSLATVPLGVLGVISLVAGLVIRHPTAQTDSEEPPR